MNAEEQEVAADLMGDSDGARATLVGRLDPASRVKPDSEVELSVNTEKLQFFDLETGFAV